MSAGQKPSSMTARQEKWFASILESMERLTGKTLDDWVAVAKTCPETKLGAWKAWFKETHGIGTNRASAILGQGVPRDGSLGRAGQLARYPLGGGGVIPGYRAVLPFDGQHYPENPSVEPAYRLKGNAAEQIIVGDSIFSFFGESSRGARGR